MPDASCKRTSSDSANPDNYLVSCQLCNQKYKKAKFSIKGTKLKCSRTIRKNTSDNYINRHKGTLAPDPLDTVTAVPAFENLHRAERPFLVNPYVDVPDQFYGWQADDTLRRVRLIARPGLTHADRYIKAAEEDLGLNRIELQDLRYATYQIFSSFHILSQDPGISPQNLALAQNQLTQMTQDNAAFAGMLRYFAQHPGQM